MQSLLAPFKSNFVNYKNVNSHEELIAFNSLRDVYHVILANKMRIVKSM
jgi:hypothetical protein